VAGRSHGRVRPDLAREDRKSTSWLERITLGQLALKLVRELQVQTRAYVDVRTLVKESLIGFSGAAATAFFATGEAAFFAMG
jgi:hypothetical protein